MIGMAKGMVATFKHLLRPAITLRYPDVKRVLPERSRTMFVAALDENDVPLCKACMLCVKNCPDGAISVEFEKNPDGPGRILTHMSIDLGLCMYCGICVEDCTSSALLHTGDYERATPDKGDTLVVLYDTDASAAPSASGGPVGDSGTVTTTFAVAVVEDGELA